MSSSCLHHHRVAPLVSGTTPYLRDIFTGLASLALESVISPGKSGLFIVFKDQTVRLGKLIGFVVSLSLSRSTQQTELV